MIITFKMLLNLRIRSSQTLKMPLIFNFSRLADNMEEDLQVEKIIFKWPFKYNFSSLRSSSILSANMKLKIRYIFHIGMLLVLKFSSILKVILISPIFVHINVSFITLVFLESASNFEHFWFLNLINPSSHSKVTGILVIQVSNFVPNEWTLLCHIVLTQEIGSAIREIFETPSIYMCTYRLYTYIYYSSSAQGLPNFKISKSKYFVSFPFPYIYIFIYLYIY